MTLKDDGRELGALGGYGGYQGSIIRSGTDLMVGVIPENLEDVAVALSPDTTRGRQPQRKQAIPDKLLVALLESPLGADGELARGDGVASPVAEILPRGLFTILQFRDHVRQQGRKRNGLPPERSVQVHVMSAPPEGLRVAVSVRDPRPWFFASTELCCPMGAFRHG